MITDIFAALNLADYATSISRLREGLPGEAGSSALPEHSTGLDILDCAIAKIFAGQ